MKMKKPQTQVPPGEKLHKSFTNLIRGVEESKPRQRHLDEMDDDGELRDDNFERLFDRPDK